MFSNVREIPLFAKLTQYEFDCLWVQGEEQALESGSILFLEGDPPRGLYVLLEGAIEITKRIGDQVVVLANHGPGAFVGEISLLTGAPHTAAGRVTKPSRVLRFGPEVFDEMRSSPIASLVLSTMAERLRTTELLVQQHEKLSGLGRMAAGLAHELNNPASASMRAARQLPAELAELQRLGFELSTLQLSQAQMRYVTDLQSELLERSAHPAVLDSLEQSDREEALNEWLQDQGIDDPWEISPGLVSAGIDTDELQALAEALGPAALPAGLRWLAATLAVLGLLRMIERSTTRIVDLIAAVKAYSYMDQSPLQEVDIHEGIENTLIMLGHKLKKFTVTREYDHTLPKITVFGSELNQVWTNLIDNAIDAMGDNGKLSVRTWREGDWIHVEIGDNGPGIPPDIQSRIFEPFFTTKSVGKGTGLGLDISYRIIVDRHKGSIRVESTPGDTRFTVCLPVNRES